MKAKVIGTCFYNQGKLVPGEIVEIVPGMEIDAEGIWSAPAGKLFLCKKQDGTFAYSLPQDLQLLPEESSDTDWQSFRREAAKLAMAGILAAGDSWDAQLIESRSNGKCTFPSEIAEFAIACADELIRQLKDE